MDGGQVRVPHRGEEQAPRAREELLPRLALQLRPERVGLAHQPAPSTAIRAIPDILPQPAASREELKVG